MKQKRILTIQDLSCVGKCSLTVALPIISSYGIETAILPTSILSNHTAFPDFSFLDMNNEIDIIIEKWKKNGFKFDLIYTGYIGSIETIEKILKYKKDLLNPNGKLIVDPAFGDYGKLYVGFNQEYVDKMMKLCKEADIILPNLTEASYLLKEEYKNDYNEDYLFSLLEHFKLQNINNVILKGIKVDNNFGVLSYYNNKKEYYFHEYLKKSYHGTGDIFASVFVSNIVLNNSIFDSVRKAADFTIDTIKETIDDDITYGTNFETIIKKKMY